MIHNFIWDFDGTLFDTYPVLGELLHHVFKEYGIDESTQEIISSMKVSMSYMQDTYLRKYPLSGALFKDYESRSVEYEREFLKPFPFAKDICESIVQNAGKNFLFTHRGLSALDFLKNAGLEAYFTECVTKENGFKRKPDPEAIFYLLKKYQLNPLETVMIGDRDIDVLSGKAAGILTCYCDLDSSRKPEFVDYSFSSLKGITTLVNL